ncbi:capsule biosynthesis GfcC family protein [Vibrio sp. 10N]|uniref:capsule biosynthesis GfcC family protein n=1 Tax=Vibrio sp. 10N TaxID=3058938 RepID=UPI00281345A6|nr:capsule biosynthesis GfcC family protein [Vibrio sp. 10N]
MFYHGWRNIKWLNSRFLSRVMLPRVLAYPLVVFITFAATFPASSAELSIMLQQQSVRLEYPQPARLDTILRDTNNQAQLANVQLDYLQAQLFSLDKQSSIDSKKVQVVAQLKALQAHDASIGAYKILNHIESSQFQYREFTSLDYDEVQSLRNGNPQLVGHYHLNIGARNNKINFLGAVEQPESIVHQAQWFLADYFNALGGIRLDSASHSSAFVIQPDGKVMEIAYGIWNFQPHFLAPGAIVYVPFKSLPSEFSSLNQDIADLLRHKVNHNE